MELTKSQERRLAFVASLLSLNPNDPNDRIKALRHLNLDENACFHGFQYSQGFMEFFIFLDEDTPLEKAYSARAIPPTRFSCRSAKKPTHGT